MGRRRSSLPGSSYSRSHRSQAELLLPCCPWSFQERIRIFHEGPERNKALGYLVAVLSGGFAAGAVAGGALTTFLGWRWVMFINVPIGIVTVLLCLRYLPGGGGWLKNQPLDAPGALTVTSGIILLIYGLTNAAALGFASEWSFIPLISSALVLAGFVFIESGSKAPLMPLDFIRRGSVLTANILALVLTSIVGGVGFIVPVYFQNVLGYSAFNSGLLTLPPALILFVVGALPRLVWSTDTAPKRSS